MPLVYPLQFEMHGADEEGYEFFPLVQTEGEHQGAEGSMVRPDFVLSDEMYSDFNR